MARARAFLLACMPLVPALGPAAEGDVTVAREGVGGAVVVIASDAPASLADDLVEYVQKSSGAKLTVVDAAAPVSSDEPRGRLFVGPAFLALADVEPASLGADGFVIRTVGPDGLLLAGANASSTGFAISAFLETHLGVRWFMPGELGEVVPRHATIAVADVDRVEKPSFEMRDLWGYRNAPEQFTRWRRRLRASARVRAHFSHAYRKYVPPDRHFAAHPEDFALWLGRRDPAQPCTSNADVRRLVVAGVKKVFSTYPTLTYASMSPNDGHVFCQCDACRSLDTPDGDYGRRTLWFANAVAAEVAEALPGRGVAFYAYADHHKAPADLVPRDNVVPVFARWLSCRRHPMDGDCPRIREREDIRQWASMSRKSYIREYYVHAWENWAAPWVGVETVGRDIPWYHATGVRGLNAEGGGNFNDGFCLTWYVIYRLLWDVTLDWRDLVEDYVSGLYGKAAPAMRRYYGRQIEATSAMTHGAIYTAELLDALEHDLDEAMDLAAGDALCARRVALSRGFLRGTRLAADLGARIASYDAGPTWPGLRHVVEEADRMRAFIAGAVDAGADPRWIRNLERSMRQEAPYRALFESFPSAEATFLMLEDFKHEAKARARASVQAGRMEHVARGYITGNGLRVRWDVDIEGPLSKAVLLVRSYRRARKYATFGSQRNADVGPLTMRVSRDGGVTWVEKVLDIRGWQTSAMDITTLAGEAGRLLIEAAFPPRSRSDVRLADLKVVGVPAG